MSETEMIELLLLQNRGVVDAPEMLQFDAAVVAAVYLDILRAGYLRSLASIPSLADHPSLHSQYIFSSSGRRRFHHLERQLKACPEIGRR